MNLRQFKTIGHLGSGTYGSVDRVTIGNNTYARKSGIEGYELIREISILKSLNHPNVLEYIGAYAEPHDQFLYTPVFRCDLNGSDFRRDLLAGKLLMNFDTCIKDMLAGLSYVHSMGYIHGDINLRNFLIDGEHVVLADFGFARKPIETVSSDKQYYFKIYRPPELLKVSNPAERICKESDLWALGVCFVALRSLDNYKTLIGYTGLVCKIPDIVLSIVDEGDVPYVDYLICINPEDRFIPEEFNLDVEEPEITTIAKPDEYKTSLFKWVYSIAERFIRDSVLYHSVFRALALLDKLATEKMSIIDLRFMGLVVLYIYSYDHSEKYDYIDALFENADWRYNIYLFENELAEILNRARFDLEITTVFDVISQDCRSETEIKRLAEEYLEHLMLGEGDADLYDEYLYNKNL